MKQSFYHVFVLKSEMIRYFTLRFPFCYHSLYFRKQHLHMCIFPFLHVNTP